MCILVCTFTLMDDMQRMIVDIVQEALVDDIKFAENARHAILEPGPQVEMKVGFFPNVVDQAREAIELSLLNNRINYDEYYGGCI